MRVKYEGRWSREQLINSLSNLLNSFGEDGIEYFHGVNLYLSMEDEDYCEVELTNENDSPIEMIRVKNLAAPKKPRKRRKPKTAAPVVDITDFKRRKDGA